MSLAGTIKAADI